MRKQNLIHYTLSKELSVHVTYCRWMWLRSWFTNMLYIHGRIYFPLDDLLNKDLENVKRIEFICFGIYGKQNTLRDITTAWFHCLYKILKQEKCENKLAFSSLYLWKQDVFWNQTGPKLNSIFLNMITSQHWFPFF